MPQYLHERPKQYTELKIKTTKIVRPTEVTKEVNHFT